MPREIAGVFAGEAAAILPAGGQGRYAEIYGRSGVCQDMRRDAAGVYERLDIDGGRGGCDP